MWILIPIAIIIVVITIYAVKPSKAEQAERAMKDELEARRNQYQMSSSAKIDFDEYFNSSKYIRSQLLAQYLSDVCEESIPTLTNIYSQAHNDKSYVESEVAAYLYFCCYTLMKGSNLNTDDLVIKYSSQCDYKGRAEDIFWNRKMIYEDIYLGSQFRAHWDVSGELTKNVDNPLISCFIVLSDFIWEPHMKDVRHYDDYCSQPLTIKSITAAMDFQATYTDALLQVCMFMEMIAGTASRLNLL